MKRCRIILPRDSEGLERAIRKAIKEPGVELVFEVGDVDAAIVEEGELSESVTKGGQEVGTAALIASMKGKITRIEQEWRGES